MIVTLIIRLHMWQYSYIDVTIILAHVQPNGLCDNHNCKANGLNLGVPIMFVKCDRLGSVVLRKTVAGSSD